MIKLPIKCHYDELLPIEDVLKKFDPQNTNTHTNESIKRFEKVLAYQGWLHPVVISKNTNILNQGHKRTLAAINLKQTHIPVVYKTFDSIDQEKAASISDNSTAQDSKVDLKKVNELIPQFDGTTFNIEWLGIPDFQITPEDKFFENEDTVPEIKKTFVKKDDLWILGNHRLLCGDATKKEDVERLMNGQKADMVFTDPPYGMNLDTDYSSMIQKHGGKGQSFKKVEGDSKPFNPSHLLNLAEDVFLFGGDYYAQRLPEGGSWIVWDKRESERTGSQMGEAMYGSAFELCWSKRPHKRMIARILWAGGVGEGISEDRKGRNNQLVRCHPTQKPISLAEWFFERWGKDKTNIVDLYLGSGSTLIACEKTNRKCFGMEIDPQYCQVILERWAKFTGKDPIREDGTTLTQLKNS